MKLGIFNARGINNTEHFIPLEIEELKRQGHEVEHYWIKGRHPTKEEASKLDFAIFHFVPTALHFCNIGVPFCILPTANDIFPNNGQLLKLVEQHPNCKFIGYQSFYHKKKYEEWGLKKPFVHIPHCVRVESFKRQAPYNPYGNIIAGGRLIPKKGLSMLKFVENLTIFGDGPLKDDLVHILPVSTQFTGYLGSQQLRELYEGASVYLYPAIVTPDGDSDGIPNTIKEAMLMELPIIASSVAGIPEFENITLLKDWEKINDILRDLPKEANTKGRKEILNNFSPKGCVDKLIKAIEEFKC